MVRGGSTGVTFDPCSFSGAGSSSVASSSAPPSTKSTLPGPPTHPHTLTPSPPHTLTSSHPHLLTVSVQSCNSFSATISSPFPPLLCSQVPPRAQVLVGLLHPPLPECGAHAGPAVGRHTPGRAERHRLHLHLLCHQARQSESSLGGVRGGWWRGEGRWWREGGGGGREGWWRGEGRVVEG